MQLTIRSFRVIDLLATVLCALLGARAVANVLEGRLQAAPPRTRRCAAAGASEPSKHIEGILERNIFCSGCPPILAREAEALTQAPPAPRPSSLPLKLRAIMSSPQLGSRWSLAVIRDNEVNAAGPFVVGADLRGWTIQAIRPTRVYLAKAAALEYLDLLEAPPAPAPVARSSSSTDPLTATVEKGLKKTGERSFEVQRSAVDALLGNVATLSGTVRIQPESRGGRPIGFRLFLRPETPLARLGLQDRDVITAINGLEMSSPEQVLPIYSKLKTASHLSIALERGGRKTTLDYDIR